MELNKNTPVGDIVRENFNTAQIFEKFQIDFCCGGNLTLNEACQKVDVKTDTLLARLLNTLNAKDKESSFYEKLPLNWICEYIVDTHHAYVKDNIPFIQQKLEKLCEVHGKNHNELFQIKQLFEESATHLTNHIKKEENVLFPYIKRLVEYQTKHIGDPTSFGNILNPIGLLTKEHEAEGLCLSQISTISDKFTPPADGCQTYQVTFKKLNEFENDLHKHIHLENNILFPKAITLEMELVH